MSLYRCTIAKFALLCALVMGGASAVLAESSSDDIAFGPLLSRFPLTLDEGERMEVLGPLFYKQRKESEITVSFPPLYTHVLDAEADSEEYDFVYPLLSYDRFGKESRWHLFQLLSFAGGQDQDSVPARRFTLFPIYFQQRSPDTNLNYTALVPFYGHLKKRLFKDEIFFVGFPIYAETRKRDVVTDNYVYPFFHIRHGDSLEGWQFWPVYGREHKDVTYRTNGFNEAELIGGHDRKFIGWPIYLNNTNNIGTENPEEQFAVIPFYARTRSPLRDSTSAFWPFFIWTDDRQRKYREWDMPWPMIVFARGEGKTVNRVFPFFSEAHNQYVQSDFYMWPVYKYNRIHSGPLDRERTRILLFLYSHVIERNLETKKDQTRTAVWPLYRYNKEFDGRSRLQVIAPLEPLLPLSKSIDRNWSPLWSFWRAEKNPKTGHSSQSLFWNLYRSEKTPTSKKNSLLFGLFQYQSDSESKSVKLFYIPLTNSKKDSDHASEHR